MGAKVLPSLVLNSDSAIGFERQVEFTEIRHKIGVICRRLTT
jgi:hypothetical protein